MKILMRFGLLLSALLYIPSVHAPFAFDDVVQLQRYTSHIWAFSEAVHGPRPLSSLLWWLCWQFGHGDPFPHHIVSMGLHALIALIVFECVLAFTRQPWAAFVGAAVFAVHPLASQSVIYAFAGQATLLCALFYAMGILATIQLARRAHWTWALLFLGSVACAWSAKEEGVMLLPAAVFVYSAAAGQWRKQEAWTAVLAIGILFVLNAGKLLEHTYAKDSLRPGLHLYQVSHTDTIVSNFSTISLYFLPRFLIPARLSLDPDVQPLQPKSVAFVFSVLVFLALIVIAILPHVPRLLRIGAGMLVVAPWTARALDYSSFNFIEEHHAYIPLLALPFIVASLFAYLERQRQGAGLYAISLLVLLLGMATTFRATVWADNETIWSDAARKAATNPRPWSEYGNILMQRGRWRESEWAYMEALRRNSAYATAGVNLSVLLMYEGRLGEAEPILRTFTDKYPQFAELWINYGVLRLTQKQWIEAIRIFNHVLQFDPRNGYAFHNRGEARLGQGRFGEAEKDFRTALEVLPTLSIAKTRLMDMGLRP